MIFSTKKMVFRTLSSFSFLLLAASAVNAQCSCWGVYPLVKQRLVPNVYISPQVNGYTEVLPPGYNPNGNTRYPLIINVPGRGAAGFGTEPELCAAACEGLGFKLEQTVPTGSGDFRFLTTVTHNGQSYSYIILTLQYKWGDQQSAADVDAMINFALANYKVDPARVYLTGLSAGANMVVNYMGTSVQNARKVAAVISVGLCMGANEAAARNMGTNNIRYWGLVGANDQQCGWGNTSNQANRVNAYSPPGNPMGKYTYFVGPNGDGHIIWPDVQDKDYRVDGKNFSEWFIQFSSAAGGSLPATLDAYNIFSKNNQVLAEWTTTVESNTDYFAVERAGADLQFREIGRVAAAGNSTTRVSYSFADVQPIKGISYYRIALMNKDGVKEYYETKKITNKLNGTLITISPVPVNKSLQLTLDLDQAQKVNILMRDVNGKTISSWSSNFNAGYGNFPINTSALTPGLYYLQIQGEHFSETKKFIKQ